MVGTSEKHLPAGVSPQAPSLAPHNKASTKQDWKKDTEKRSGIGGGGAGEMAQWLRAVAALAEFSF